MAAWLCLFLSFLTIRVLPHIVVVNESIRVTCLVAHRAENRRLIIAVEGYRESEYALEGEAAPGVFEATYDHVPCRVEMVSCTLVEGTGKVVRAALPVQVGGC